MTTFRVISHRTVIEFSIETADRVTSFGGTDFVPNHCRARIQDGEIVSISLEKLDENGWGIDDPAGPDGEELAASFSGPEITGQPPHATPRVAQDALKAAAEAMTA